jgi:hypothetical protein
MGNPRVSVGQVNYYIPSVRGGLAKSDDEKFLLDAARSIPSRLNRFATRLDGSNWIYPIAYHDRVNEIKREYDGRCGIRVYVSSKITWDNEGELWRAIRDSISERVAEIATSLKESLGRLSKEFSDIEPAEGDSKIISKVAIAQRRLKEASFVIASFSLTEDFEEARKALEMTIESELEKARIELGRKNRHVQRAISDLK